MSEWIDFDQWPRCQAMERPGVVFEVTNEQQTLLTTCVIPLEIPFDWKSAPVKFRVVSETQPRHSGPLPPPAQPR